MKLIGFLLCSVVAASRLANASDVNSGQEQIRTAIPWLYLLALSAAQPQIPILRPQDETLAITNSAIMKEPQADEIVNSDQTNNEVREQFLHGILLGLQQPGSPTISPAVLSDFIAQATTTTRKPAVEKDANGAENDEDVDYIDFKNGSRIKYDLDDVEQPVNKILQRTTKRPAANPPQSTALLYYRTPTRYVYYRPIYGPTPYYYRVG